MGINKLKFDILGLSETHFSSDIEILHHVPSLDQFTNNCSTLDGGVLLFVRDTINANELVNYSVMLEHLETISASFSTSEINYAKGGVYRPTYSNNDDFMSEFSNSLNNALADFQNSVFFFVIVGDFTTFNIRSNQTGDVRSLIYYLLHLGFSNNNETNQSLI